MGFIKEFKTDLSFWDLHQQFKTIEPFKSLYKKDKSKDRKDSSMLMWGLAFYYDEDSLYYNMTKSDKEMAIGNGHFGSKNFDWNSIKDLMDAYASIYLTPAKRQLFEWNRLMDEKTEFMSSQTYSQTNWEMLEKMMISNKALYTEYENIRKRLAGENDTEGVKGGATESASEVGLI